MILKYFLLQLGWSVLVLVATNWSRFNWPCLLVPWNFLVKLCRVKKRGGQLKKWEKAVLPALHVKPKQCSGSISNENNSLIPSKYPQALIYFKKLFFSRGTIIVDPMCASFIDLKSKKPGPSRQNAVITSIFRDFHGSFCSATLDFLFFYVWWWRCTRNDITIDSESK